LQIEVN